VHLQLSPLEFAILERLRQLDLTLSQPPTETVEVLSREFTPCGRYVTLKATGLKPGAAQLDMIGISHGITADLTITGSGNGVLEVIVNGGGAWDGQEHAFQFT
jgi:hypothetical protein